MKRLALILLVLLSLSMGCASNWWDNPPLIEGKISAVGVARFVGNESVARSAATANALQSLSAFVGTQIQSLTETWGKQAGDDKAASTLSNYFNDETINRQLTNTVIRGAVPRKYEKHGKYMYVLVVLETKKFAEYWKDAGSKTLGLDKTLLLTEALKENYSNKMDGLINNYLNRVSKGLRAPRKNVR